MSQTINFYSIFRLNTDGSIEPIHPVRIGSAQLGPGVRFGPGVLFGNIDISKYIGRNFSVEIINGVYVIVGIF